jgi:hypothetical protein
MRQHSPSCSAVNRSPREAGAPFNFINFIVANSMLRSLLQQDCSMGKVAGSRSVSGKLLKPLRINFKTSADLRGAVDFRYINAAALLQHLCPARCEWRLREASPLCHFMG